MPSASMNPLTFEMLALSSISAYSTFASFETHFHPLPGQKGLYKIELTDREDVFYIKTELHELEILEETGTKPDNTENKYVYAIGKVGDEVKLLLDPDRLLNDEGLTNLENDTDSDDEEERGEN